MPGNTNSPRASISWKPPASSGPIPLITPSSIARSAGFTPSGVTTVPPRTTTSVTPRLHLFQKPQARHQRGGDVFLQHGFAEMMTDPAGAAEEQHRGGHALCDDHRVVAGAADHPVNRITRVGHCALQGARKRSVHRDLSLIEMALPGNGQSAPRGDLLGGT